MKLVKLPSWKVKRFKLIALNTYNKTLCKYVGGGVTGKFVPSPYDSPRCSLTQLSLETQIENSIYRLSISGNYRQSARQATMKTSVKFPDFANYTEAGVTLKLDKFIKVLALEESINFRQLILLSCKPRTV